MTIQFNTKAGPVSYTTVAERVARAHASGKPFEIVTSQALQVGDRWVWRVEIRLGELRYAGSAVINFDAKSGSAEAKDPLATAETSAVGRALGFAGILSDDSIATIDEIERGPVERPQPQRPQPQQQQQAKSPASDRLNALYERGKQANQWTSSKEMMDRMSTILDTPINRETVRELTSDLLDLVEQALSNTQQPAF